MFMKKLIVKVLSISIYAQDVNGFRGAIITESSAANESGVWKKTTKQLERFAQQVGAPDLATLARHAKDSLFSFEATPVKAGESWENEATGESGKYTKDHLRINNETLELSQMNNMMLSAASQIAKNVVGAMFASAPASAVSTEPTPDFVKEEANLIGDDAK